MKKFIFILLSMSLSFMFLNKSFAIDNNSTPINNSQFYELNNHPHCIIDSKTNNVWYKVLDGIEYQNGWEGANNAVKNLNANNVCGVNQFEMPNQQTLNQLTSYIPNKYISKLQVYKWFIQQGFTVIDGEQNMNYWGANLGGGYATTFNLLDGTTSVHNEQSQGCAIAVCVNCGPQKQS